MTLNGHYALYCTNHAGVLQKAHVKQLRVLCLQCNALATGMRVYLRCQVFFPVNPKRGDFNV